MVITARAIKPIVQSGALVVIGLVMLLLAISMVLVPPVDPATIVISVVVGLASVPLIYLSARMGVTRSERGVLLRSLGRPRLLPQGASVAAERGSTWWGGSTWVPVVTFEEKEIRIVELATFTWWRKRAPKGVSNATQQIQSWL